MPMKSALLEIQPTAVGDQISWLHFHRNRIKLANALEKRLRMTVQLTDAITHLIAVSRAVDPVCCLRLSSKHGLLFPNFIIRLESERFELEIEKTFSGGGNRENIFNFTVISRISAGCEEILQQLVKSYHELGPKPLHELVYF